MNSLTGIETEYGLYVDGHSAGDQVEDATDFVNCYPGPSFIGWNYRYESPRADLRGFTLKHLSVDPEDVQFDAGRTHGADHEVRADRILPNGARFYNDHGHPEYSTPECRSIHHLAAHDAAGQVALLRTARAYEAKTGHAVRLYKNNTDFHGASYGTHENHLVPRLMGFERLCAAVTPMLVARQILVGSGKVGSESGRNCTYQISQRADFFTEPFNAETLYRRPVFNTRDEPHADPAKWIRLHVIAGDANMIPSATARKIGLVRLAVALAEIGEAPIWRLSNPVEACKSISRDESYEFTVPLEGRSWTTAYEVLESYFAAAERTLELDEDLLWTIKTSRQLLIQLKSDFDEFRRHVDWAAKRSMLESFMEEEGLDWRNPSLQAFDLEYHNINPEDGLHAALEQMGRVEHGPAPEDLEACLEGQTEPTRAFARGLAVSRFPDAIRSACWRTVTMETEEGLQEVDLPPDADFPAELKNAMDVGSFVQCLRGVK